MGRPASAGRPGAAFPAVSAFCDGSAIRTLTLIVLGWSLALVSVATADTPAFVATGGDLVVTVANVGLYDVNPSTGAARQMAGGSDAYSVSFSRDGTRMLFLDQTTLMVADGDGRNAEPLLSNGPMSDPKLSPDGTKVAFIRNGALFVRNLREAASERQLTSPPAPLFDVYPDWAPTGDRILVARWTPGAGTTMEIVGAGGGEQPWVYNGAGFRYPDDGKWSPDGGRIAVLEAGGVENGGYHMTVFNADGTSPQLVTPNRARPAIYAPPVWSPDGLTLAFYDWEPNNCRPRRGGRPEPADDLDRERRGVGRDVAPARKWSGGDDAGSRKPRRETAVRRLGDRSARSGRSRRARSP